jgi:hypothetical protein
VDWHRERGVWEMVFCRKYVEKNQSISRYKHFAGWPYVVVHFVQLALYGFFSFFG